MQEHIAEVTRQIRGASAKTALIAAAFIGLELMERAGMALAELGPEANYPAFEEAVRETTEAATALATAPSLTWPERDYLEATSAHEEFTAQLTTLSLAVHQALVLAATKSVGDGDRIACLEAALHASRAHHALR
jgi:hypothetical protein